MSEKTQAEFEAEWSKFASFRAVLNEMPLEALRDTAYRAESIGPLLYPTETRASFQSLRDQQAITRAAIAFRDAMNEAANR